MNVVAFDRLCIAPLFYRKSCVIQTLVTMTGFQNKYYNIRARKKCNCFTNVYTNTVEIEKRFMKVTEHKLKSLA